MHPYTTFTLGRQSGDCISRQLAYNSANHILWNRESKPTIHPKDILMSTVTRPQRKKRRNLKPEGKSVEPITTVEGQEINESPLEHGVAHDDDHPTPFIHKLVVLITVFAPMAGFAWAIALAWQTDMVRPIDLGMLIAGWFLTGLGLTIGFHRMLTHRSFDTHNWNRLLWAGIGTLALEGPPLAWCAVHRKHHQH